MATARVLARDAQQYAALAEQLLPSHCPRCNADKTHLILDSEDFSYAYCWSHFGDIYIGPVRDNTKPKVSDAGAYVSRTPTRRKKYPKVKVLA